MLKPKKHLCFLKENSIFVAIRNSILLKRSGYILLLVVLLLQPGGMVVFYKLQQAFRKWEMDELLNHPETKFQKLTLTIDQYNGSKVEEHEISLNGEMFDIRQKTVKDGNVELLVIRDKDEENILKRIFSITHKTHPPGRDFTNQLQQLLALNYLAPLPNIILFADVFNFSINHAVVFEWRAVFHSINTPPPRLI